jgi:thiamine-phosphate pyrophosphorylase
MLGSEPGLYAIVDPGQCPDGDPERVAAAVLRGGCAVLQLRAKRLTDAGKLTLGRRLAARARRSGVPFVMNDRVDIALLAGADGVHLGQDDLPVAEARRLVGDRPIGVSTHDGAQAERAVDGGADLIGFGPVFATSSKERPDPLVGLDGLREVSSTSAVPVVAIGGMTEERAGQARRAGATWVAAIGALCAAEDPEQAARAIHRAAGGVVGPEQVGQGGR